MLEKLTDEELEGFIDLYENLTPKTRQQKFQSRLLATIVHLRKQLKLASEKKSSKKTQVYKKALEDITRKYAPSNGAAKIAKEALEK